MNSRLSTLFSLVCKAKKKITIEYLARKCEVSERTIYNDLKKLNELLLKFEYEGLFLEKGTVSYPYELEIPFESLILKDTGLIEANSTYRKTRLIEEILLGPEHFTIDYLMQKILVSRNTMQKDLKDLKQLFHSFDIEIHSEPFKGFQIKGEEYAIRKLFIQTIQQDPLFFKTLNSRHLLPEEKIVEELISTVVDLLNMEVSDEGFHLLKCSFWVTIHRSRKGYEFTNEVISDGVIFGESITKKIQNTIRSKGIKINSYEWNYLLVQIRQSSTMSKQETVSENWLLFNLFVDEVVEKMSKKLDCPYIRIDRRLYEGLLNHLKPAYYRMKSETTIENPLYKYVLNTHGELFYKLKRIISDTSSILEIHFNNHEISYMVLFFIASLKRYKQRSEARKDIIIVCGAGISTSEILRTQIQAMFNVSIKGSFSKRGAKRWLKNNTVDFVISTIDMKVDSVPVIKVSPYLTNDEALELFTILGSKKSDVSIEEILTVIKDHISLDETVVECLRNDLKERLGIIEGRQVEGEVYQPMLLEVLSKDLITTNYHALDKVSAVQKAGELLVDKGYAESSYVKGMLQNLQENGTYIVISPGIAMPHARPEEGAKDIGLSIVTLKEPIPFGHPKNDPVEIVIGLCAVDHQTHLRALSELVEIIEDEEKLNKLKQAKSAEEVLNIIKDKELNESKEEI